MGSFEPISVAISVQFCSNGCSVDDNDEIMGEILYSGDYTPQQHESSKPPYQNFTFTFDSSTPSGPAVMHAVEFFLEGVSQCFFLFFLAPLVDQKIIIF